MFIDLEIKQNKSIPFGIILQVPGKEYGMRIDHFLLSNSLIENIKSININKKPRSKENLLIIHQLNLKLFNSSVYVLISNYISFF